MVEVGKPAPGFSGNLKNLRKIKKQGIDKFLEGKSTGTAKLSKRRRDEQVKQCHSEVL